MSYPSLFCFIFGYELVYQWPMNMLETCMEQVYRTVIPLAYNKIGIST